MRLWRRQASSKLHKNNTNQPILWPISLLVCIGLLVALFLWYASALHAHIHSDRPTKLSQDFDTKLGHRIPVLKETAKHYASDYSLQPKLDIVEITLLYIAPLVTLLISILFIFVARLLYVTKQRSLSLAQLNEDLQKETAEHLRTEEMRQNLEKALLQGQKLQAIGTLAGGIAHDFNNLLYAIIGYAEMAQEDVPKTSLLHKNLGKILEAAERGRDLIARILAFSRRQQHELKPIPLKSTIEGVLSLLKPTIPASVMIHFVTKLSGECLVMGNETQLHQVIVNIINNAVDAMDDEGTINIHLSLVLAHDTVLKQFPEISDGNYYKIEMSDTGHGMDKATVDRIFEPFFTTKAVGKGTGLGLATAHGIIKEHHGEILVHSRLGEGSTFTIFLPEYSVQKGV